MLLKKFGANALAVGLALGLMQPEVLCAEEDPSGKLSEFNIPIIINGEPVEGRLILPVTDTVFRFKLKATDDVIEMRWSQLDEAERKRIQKICNLDVSKDDGRIKFGNKITGVRYLLENGKRVEGLLLTERCRDGIKAIRTATVPYMLVYEKDIKETQAFESYESDFYSAHEIYERMLLEKPPGTEDAAAHLEIAKTCGNMGLYKEALEHLKIAEIIDPRTIERNADDRKALIAEYARMEGKKLYTQLMSFYRGQDFFSAKSVLEKLDRNFPNHEDRSRWDTIRQEITDGCSTILNKQVIQSAYYIATDLILEKYSKKVKLDEKGNVVPSIPGKQVTTRQGDIFRGTIIDPNSDGKMVMKVGDVKAGSMTLKIRAKDIMSVQDIDLSVGVKSVAPLYDDLKEYVNDTGSPTGLKGQMLARIAQQTSTPLAKVKEIFDSRLSREATYEDGKLVKAPIYVTDHVVSYDIGSWLRAGSRIMAAPQAAPQRNKNAAATEESLETTDDPAVWWKYQRSDVHLLVLKAMAAEKLFSPTGDVEKIACKNCGNKGIIPQVGRTEEVRCPDCRGMGVMFKIRYH